MSSSIVDQLASSLTTHGINVISISDGNYSLAHHLTPEQFHEIVLPIFAELNLKPQDDSWMPGTPTGDQEDFGYYVCSEESDTEWTLDIFVTNNTIYWC